MVKKSKQSFLDQLIDKVENAKRRGLEIGKITAEEAAKLGEEIKEHGKEKITEGVSAAKKLGYSSEKDLELLEKFGKLKKSGIITQKEYEDKKKEILKRI